METMRRGTLSKSSPLDLASKNHLTAHATFRAQSADGEAHHSNDPYSSDKSAESYFEAPNFVPGRKCSGSWRNTLRPVKNRGINDVHQALTTTTATGGQFDHTTTEMSSDHHDSTDEVFSSAQPNSQSPDRAAQYAKPIFKRQTQKSNTTSPLLCVGASKKLSRPPSNFLSFPKSDSHPGIRRNRASTFDRADHQTANVRGVQPSNRIARSRADMSRCCKTDSDNNDMVKKKTDAETAIDCYSSDSRLCTPDLQQSEPTSYLRQRLNILRHHQVRSAQSPSHTIYAENSHSASKLEGLKIFPHEKIQKFVNSNSVVFDDSTTSSIIKSRPSDRMKYQQQYHLSDGNHLADHHENSLTSESHEDDESKHTKTTTTIPSHSNQVVSNYPTRDSTPMSQAFPENFKISTSQRTRSQLAELQEKIVKFEDQLQIETEHRKAVGENKICVLKGALGSLEKTLEAEIRRRLDTNKTIQLTFESNLSTLEAKMERAVEHKYRYFNENLKSLELKLTDTETKAKDILENQNQKILLLENQIDNSTNQLQLMKENIMAELEVRRQRADVILDKINDLEKQIDDRLHLEKSVRERDMTKLKEMIINVKNHHISSDEIFQEELAQQFLDLKTAIQDEVKAREAADDDIVQALNHYTLALQSALRIANNTSQ